MKKAWIENNKVRDIAQGNPAEIYHPDIASHYDTDVPDDISAGASLIDGVWTNSPPIAPYPRFWTNEDVRKNLNFAERVKWDNDATNGVKTAKSELFWGKKLEQTTEILQFLVNAGDITQASMDKILA